LGRGEGYTFTVVIRNHSDWPIDIVWENAQDLEHVACLHGNTNYGFRLIDVQPGRDGLAYEAMTFMVRRRLFGFVPVTNFGFRRITGPFEICQIDASPALGITTALRSRLERNAGDPAKTDLVDTVEITVPRFLKPLRGILEVALRRHTRIQCEEDEAFRARRHELRDRGIHLPYSVLNRSLWEERFR
jgi:hypothetical protein